MATAPQPAGARNQLLASLPPDVLQVLRPRLTSVVLANRQMLCAADGPIEAVHFPESGVISLVATLGEGMQAEVGVVGWDGMLGLPLLAGVRTSFVDAVVQVPGTALRMEAAAFNREVRENAPFATAVRRYGEAFGAQVAQTAACNGRHDLEQRLSRWLLMAHDRTEGDDLLLTQELLAVMLVVHRPSVTVAASILQRAGLIRYRAGLITVLDRAGLEQAACECHATVARRVATILAAPAP